MIKLTQFAIPLAATLVCISLPLRAAEYYNQKWFDYPDIGTAPRVTIGCAHEACTDIPEFHGFKVEMHSHCACTNPTQKTELLRKDVRVVVSGPDTSDQAVKNALEGYAAGCVATAIAASTAGPQVVASPAGFFAAFKACVAAISVSGVVGSLLNQLDIHLNTSDSHWSPL
jgi:hypothetical protein